MAHGHGLVQHNLPVNAEALGTLGARTALSLNSVMNAITATFLMLQYRYILQLVGRTLADDGPVVVFLNKGDATATEIATAMQEQNTAGPDDTTQSLTEDNPYVVYQNTVHAFVMHGDGTEGVMDTGWRNFNKGKGIPATEGTGFALHAFNTGAGALTTGSSVNGQVWVRGVWLRD